MSAQPPDREIIYIGDPMCSWCWGFAPEARRLEEHFAGSADLRLVLGGLRPGNRAELFDDRLKAVIRPHWERVAALTGQPFNFDWFGREGFLFDTEPPSRAVVLARRLAPATALPFFFALQEAFYKDGIDITQLQSYMPLLERFDIDASEFTARFETAEIKQATYAEFTMAGRLGAEGFPTVILRKRDQLALLSVGYQTYANLEPAATRFFA